MTVVGRKSPAATPSDPARMAALLNHLARQVMISEGAAQLLSTHTLSRPFGDVLADVAVADALPIPEAVLKFVRDNSAASSAGPFRWPSSSPEGSPRVRQQPPSDAPHALAGASASVPPRAEQPSATAAPEAPGPTVPAPKSSPPAKAPPPTPPTPSRFNDFIDLPRAGGEHAPLPPGKYYLVTETAEHVPDEYRGLYNRFGDYQRVVALSGTRLSGRDITFCPESDSISVRSQAEADARWESVCLPFPVPRRFR